MSLITLTPPTSQRLVTSAWGADRSHRGGTHEGLDFPGEVGGPVFAAAPGVVVRVKNVDNSFAGKFIAIRHESGVVSRYLHSLKNLVSVGDVVTRGQTIALLGQSGTSGTGRAHVHFDLKLDPRAFEEYRSRFGTPQPGYGSPTALGVGVPAEALMSRVSYTDRAKKQSEAKGVQFHGAAGVGAGIGLVVALGIGVGFLAKTLK